ncbi:MAG: hypothetical protein HYR72_24125 [Deltaproteobacteria bacterium]|nr:hypothetical protein [Deltaproteobacteria bacterium]MBI3389189.1 hypothetical protein [Deltaproteobacteria bacterium]
MTDQVSQPSAVLVSGIQAAGKSTVGRLLAERFERSAFVEGDLMWRLLVSGRIDMTPDPSPEAISHLHLRYRNAAFLVDSLVAAGFIVVSTDMVLGADLTRYLSWVRTRPLRIVVLAPSVEAVVERELGREKEAYRRWMSRGERIEDAIRTFQGWINATPEIGLRIDSSKQSPIQTVDAILERWDEALV